MKMEFMTIDKMPVEIGDEKNILELIRKVGIELPTFCYYSDLSVYGACRMCVVEDNWGTIHTSCSTPPKAGMEVRTNTPRLRKYRKMILELLLASHCRDCTTCTKSGNCKNQLYVLVSPPYVLKIQLVSPSQITPHLALSAIKANASCAATAYECVMKYKMLAPLILLSVAQI